MRFPTTLDEDLQQQLLDCSEDLPTAVGDTMCTDDFYEGNNWRGVWNKALSDFWYNVKFS